MNIRNRAIHAEDKEERRHVILDAAMRLLLEHPQRIVSVDEVAARAGMAKGTVYLYFPSKEEILLGVHERHCEHFFAGMIALLGHSKKIEIDDLVRVVQERIVNEPGYLPIAGVCFGLMEKSIPVEAQRAFKMRLAGWLRETAAGVERHFPALGAGAGFALLMHSYALIVGLWQLLHPTPLRDAIHDQPELEIFKLDYATEVDRALRALWVGVLAGQAPPPPTKAKRKTAATKAKTSITSRSKSGRSR
jgi:AcrR family transcriptional regulator